ncbi:uncharacterized protein LOC110027002, partial [Phalaenopsis equestris]|uniref:uncharacterized protein LOC110027002 n=1 Tax=Phalaenopsis equestris TaxID=78828 RepID=UPI0009E47D2B
YVRLHRQLVRGFFKNASRMLWAYGEIHVSHKTAGPFSHWNLEELAAESSLLLLECANFSIEDYPGYNNKRGDGPRSDQSFPLGKCSTFKFIFGHLLKKKNPLGNTELLPSYSSISPIMDNYLDHRSINDISYPETRFPFSLERVPRSINCLEFRETAQWPFSRIDNLGLRIQGNNDFEFRDLNMFSLRMHELEHSTLPGVSLRSRVPLTYSYNTDVLEAPRRESFGYNYLRHYEELPSRRVSVMEYGGMFDRRIEVVEKTRLRELVICHGI